MSKHLKRIFKFLSIVFFRLWGFSRKYVIPAILFVESLKELLETEITEDFDLKNYFLGKLKYPVDLITRLIFAFIKVANLVLPEPIDGRKTHKDILIAYITYVKTASKVQKAFIFMKTASEIVKILIPEHQRLKTNEADFFVQMCYSFNKIKKVF